MDLDYQRLDAIVSHKTEWTILVKVDQEFWRSDFDLFGIDCGYLRKIMSINNVVIDEKEIFV